MYKSCSFGVVGEHWGELVHGVAQSGTEWRDAGLRRELRLMQCLLSLATQPLGGGNRLRFPACSILPGKGWASLVWPCYACSDPIRTVSSHLDAGPLEGRSS